MRAAETRSAAEGGIHIQIPPLIWEPTAWLPRRDFADIEQKVEGAPKEKTTHHTPARKRFSAVCLERRSLGPQAAQAFSESALPGLEEVQI